jgi:hyperosmotically inducible protein
MARRALETNVQVAIEGGQPMRWLPGSEGIMKVQLLSVAFAAATLVGCSTTTQSPDVAGIVRTSLNQAGLNKVSVNEDRDKGVVTLAGNVNSDADRQNAESIARPLVGNQVLADQIAVVPPGDTSDAKTINSDVDKGIEKNLDAALIQSGFRKGISHSVKSGVVTLTGKVNSDLQRNQIAQVASSVPNVRQVVNEIQTTHRKATSS